MKISPAYTAASLLLVKTSSSFTSPRPPQHHSPPKVNALTETPSTRLFSSTDDGDDLSSYLGEDNSRDAGYAFADIVNDDMVSLQKRLENGLNPDVRFLRGNTILHLIALKGNDKSLDDDKYRNVLVQLMKSGADLQAKNNFGFSALEFLETKKDNVFAENVRQAQCANMKAPFKQTLLDAQLATFSLQTEPTIQGKKLITDLIKSGANPEHKINNGKTIFENIESNWPEASAKAFTELVIAAKFKSIANGQGNMLNNQYTNDKWINAVMGFYKADNPGNINSDRPR